MGIGEEVTGYPLKSVFESSPGIPKGLPWEATWSGPTRPSASWPSETELWDMQGRAGIRKRSMNEMRMLSEKTGERTPVKLLKWNDEEMGGALFTTGSRSSIPSSAKSR